VQTFRSKPQRIKVAVKNRKFMNFIARIIRFLFWVLIVSWGVRVLGRVFSKLIQAGQSGTPLKSGSGDLHATQAKQLVRDPVCGVHIAEELSVPLQENGALLHFCSTACRDQYLSNSRKLAASG
jgi:YHS domain-containing protein